MKRRPQRIDSTARTQRQAVHDGARHRPKEVAARASGGGRQPRRWAKRAGSAEWASLAVGLVKGFGPNSRI
jgi:hypothetical protein